MAWLSLRTPNSLLLLQVCVSHPLPFFLWFPLPLSPAARSPLATRCLQVCITVPGKEPISCSTCCLKGFYFAPPVIVGFPLSTILKDPSKITSAGRPPYP